MSDSTSTVRMLGAILLVSVIMGALSSVILPIYQADATMKDRILPRCPEPAPDTNGEHDPGCGPEKARIPK